MTVETILQKFAFSKDFGLMKLSDGAWIAQATIPMATGTSIRIESGYWRRHEDALSELYKRADAVVKFSDD